MCQLYLPVPEVPVRVFFGACAVVPCPPLHLSDLWSGTSVLRPKVKPSPPHDPSTRHPQVYPASPRRAPIVTQRPPVRRPSRRADSCEGHTDVGWESKPTKRWKPERQISRARNTHFSPQLATLMVLKEALSRRRKWGLPWCMPLSQVKKTRNTLLHPCRSWWCVMH